MTRTPVIVARYAADTTPAGRAWMLRGICADAPEPDDWHPTIEAPTDLSTRRAINICRQCPVRPQCRDYALNRPWITGIWGATTTEERARLRRTRRRAA
ncbi:WhiB family transcriptional regulator [Halostreptopolyspora alba]|uniref:Transcriptional regulator WhiB n=1 Tax=Halostreptopolyspora alba TaxID=2487137 RepID=A0A3N0E6U6_9ACTN|nr:WhiB family transcriptional regulator [Nocardiopsaceae bacterium YIM 96095]